MIFVRLDKTAAVSRSKCETAAVDIFIIAMPVIQQDSEAVLCYLPEA